MNIDISKMRNELLSRGVDWSEQQIEDYLALKNNQRIVNAASVVVLQYEYVL